MAQPTFIAYAGSTFSDSGAVDEVTASVSWQTGDRILVFGAISNNASETLGVPTATGLTFSQVAAVNVGGVGDDTIVYLWSATAGSNGSGAITSVTSTTNENIRSGIAAMVYRGSDGLGTAVLLDGSTAKTIAVTRTGTNSHIALMMADWAQAGDAVVTATPTGTVRHASAETGQADFFVVTFGDQGATGTTSYGITDHTGTVDMSGIAVEILGTASGPAAITGSGNVPSSLPAVAGTGARGSDGSGALAVLAPTVSGTGTVNGAPGAITGSGAPVVVAAAMSGLGTRGVQDQPGPIDLLSPKPTVAGAGTVSAPGAAITGSGAPATVVPTISGAGVVGHTGSGAIAATVPAVAGSGAINDAPVNITGSGALIVQASTMSGAGSRGSAGSGALITSTPAANGNGSLAGTGGSVIGYDSIAGLSSNARTTADPHFMMSLIHTYTPSVNEIVTEVGWYSNSASGTIEVGVYRLDTLALVVSANVPAGGTGGVRNVVAVNAELVPGVTYAVAWRVVANTTTYLVNPGGDTGVRNTTLTGTNALAATFSSDGTLVNRWPMFATTEAGGAGGGGPPGNARPAGRGTFGGRIMRR